MEPHAIVTLYTVDGVSLVWWVAVTVMGEVVYRLPVWASSKDPCISSDWIVMGEVVLDAPAKTRTDSITERMQTAEIVLKTMGLINGIAPFLTYLVCFMIRLSQIQVKQFVAFLLVMGNFCTSKQIEKIFLVGICGF
jgi:hypothetical protein